MAAPLALLCIAAFTANPTRSADPLFSKRTYTVKSVGDLAFIRTQSKGGK
jgi:hypothetical protein